MPKSWEDMSKEEKLAQLRSEIDSLVTNGVARRIEEIRNELKSIESIADRERSGS